MRQDVYGEIYALLASLRSVAKIGSPLGAMRPILQSGKMIIPEHCFPTQTAITVTAARYYFVPVTIDKIEAFAGVKCQTNGTADNGFKYKIAIYEESASGGPGALAKSFGEVTADGTAAIRTFASSWTPSKVGVYYLAFTSDSGAHLYSMTAGPTQASNVGFIAPPSQAAMRNPGFPTELLAANGHTSPNIGDYVAGTYANFPESTSLTPTNSIFAANGAPTMGLYK